MQRSMRRPRCLLLGAALTLAPLPGGLPLLAEGPNSDKAFAALLVGAVAVMLLMGKIRWDRPAARTL